MVTDHIAFLSRVTKVLEREKMLAFITHLYTCQYDKLPLETLAHNFIKQSKAMSEYRQCQTSRRKGDSVEKCSRKVWQYCGSSAEEAITKACHIVKLVTENVLPHNITMATVEREKVSKEIQQALLGNGTEPIKSTLTTMSLFIEQRLCFIRFKETIRGCLTDAMRRCQNANVHALEMNRMKMEDMDYVIRTFPGIRVIYYTRDPRGIALSRTKTKGLMTEVGNKSPAREAVYLCPGMRKDMSELQDLRAKYPDTIIRVKYETLAQSPIPVGRYIYQHINKTMPERWQNFAKKAMQGARGARGHGFTTKVRNATETANRWQREIPARELVEINQLCRDVLEGLGYML